MQQYKQQIESRGFRLVAWSEFVAATDRPNGLLERAENHKAGYVLYDPSADDEGWLLVGDDPDELALETCFALQLNGSGAQ